MLGAGSTVTLEVSLRLAAVTWRSVKQEYSHSTIPGSMGEGETLGVCPGVVLTASERPGSRIRALQGCQYSRTCPLVYNREFKGIHHHGLMHYLEQGCFIFAIYNASSVSSPTKSPGSKEDECDLQPHNKQTLNIAA